MAQSKTEKKSGLTKPAGYFLQLLSIPFIGYGFVTTLVVGIAMTNADHPGASLPYLVAGIISLVVGFWMLKSGQRAVNQG